MSARRANKQDRVSVSDVQPHQLLQQLSVNEATAAAGEELEFHEDNNHEQPTVIDRLHQQPHQQSPIAPPPHQRQHSTSSNHTNGDEDFSSSDVEDDHSQQNHQQSSSMSSLPGSTATPPLPTTTISQSQSGWLSVDIPNSASNSTSSSNHSNTNASSQQPSTSASSSSSSAASSSSSSSSSTTSKKMWCNLMRSFLLYAATPKELNKPKGCIALKGCSIALARSSDGTTTLPNAFTLTQSTSSHQYPHSLTFTAGSESECASWMRNLQSVITAPTHAIMSYKGRAIFDAEDADAINASRAALKLFATQQLQKVEMQRQTAREKVTLDKSDIKSLKLKKKSLAGELILMTKQYNDAVAESEQLSQELQTLQHEEKKWEKAQESYCRQLIQLVDLMDQCDPNRWTPATFTSHTFSGAFSSPNSQQLDDSNSSASGMSSLDSSFHTPQRGRSAHNSIHSSPIVITRPNNSNNASSNGGQPTISEDELLASSYMPLPNEKLDQPPSTPPPAHHQQNLSVFNPSNGAAHHQLSRSTFSTPQRGGLQSALEAAFPATYAAAANQNHGFGSSFVNNNNHNNFAAQTYSSNSSILAPQMSPTGGSNFANGNVGVPRSQTSVVVSEAVVADPTSELLSRSSGQLRAVHSALESLLHTPLHTVLQDCNLQDNSNVPSLSCTPIQQGLQSSQSFNTSATTTANAASLLSNIDTNELSAIRSATTQMLAAAVALRLEQNALTKYIDAFIRRKHASQANKA